MKLALTEFLEVIMPVPDPSMQWQKDTVVEQLRAQSQGSGSVAAQVFLHGDAGSEDLAKAARDLVDAASAKAKAQASIGRVSNLAKSFSLTASPDVFAVLAKHPAVKAILPKHIEDSYPRPTKIIRE
jgi:hypothetical protein